jgi:hypothetical protein
VDLLEAYVDPTLAKTVPARTLDVIGRALPFVRGRYASFDAFGQASIQDILGDAFRQAAGLRATWLDSTVFLNRDDRFEAVSLPAEAQLTPAFGIVAADLDGDGLEDLLLAQNFFPVEMETSRYDAGRGLWLRGQGNGRFQAVPGHESGILVYGDQRGCAAADYDRDGRLDMVITQNASQTTLWHNLRAKPGLIVHLRGPAANPHAVGAGVQLLYGARRGPMRELHAGSGYWSQDSPTLVLGGAEPPTGLIVQWPGGRRTRCELPPRVREIDVDESGKVTPRAERR